MRRRADFRRLRITVLPHASGTAMARTPKITGAFHGAMPRTTPAGCRTASEMHTRLVRRDDFTPICVIRQAASRSMLAAKSTSTPPRARSRRFPRSSAGSIRPPAPREGRPPSAEARRSPGPISTRREIARAAASTTLATSASPAAAASLATAPVTGTRRLCRARRRRRACAVNDEINLHRGLPGFKSDTWNPPWIAD